MDRTCDTDCNFCYPNEWRNKSVFQCCECIKITELPSGLDNITRLYCFGCVSLFYIPYLPSLTILNCDVCSQLTYIQELPNIKGIDLCNCMLLSEWKQRGENIRWMTCRNCPLLHLHPSLFIRFNGLDLLNSVLKKADPRPRNGVSSRLLSFFTFSKELYMIEIRFVLEIRIDEMLYAPGGFKYLELATKYKDGF